jgi:magnesium transporter
MTVYTEESWQQYHINSLNDLWQYENRDAINWIHLEGMIKAEDLDELKEHFGLHPLALEDVLNQRQHPKLEEYPGHHFITAYLLADNEYTYAHQVSFFAGTNFLITMVPDDDNAFVLVHKRLQKPDSLLRKQGVDYLVYCLIDTLIDRFFPRLESINEELGDLEDSVLRGQNKELIEQVHDLKRRLMVLEKLVWGMQALVLALRNEANGFASSRTGLYLRDCYDHTEQLLHSIDSFREISNSLTETFLSLVNNQMNQVVKVLTLIATIFIPLTFIVGVYGMNFNPHAGPLNMPELNWPYGYVFIWALMLLIAGTMTATFKHRKWL